MEPIRQKQFDGGLYFAGPQDTTPAGMMRRNRGSHPSSRNSIRTRNGSAFLQAFLNAHTLTYFASLWWQGASTVFYRDGVSIKTALNGNRLSCVLAPPTAGIVDYLLVAGGGALFKSDSSGNVTNWGIAAPASDPSAAVVAGGSLADATWTYQITYYNSTTGTRSNGNGTDVSATTSGTNNSVALTSIPDPTGVDSQIDYVEIWRSVAGGSALFYLTRIAAGTTSYTDDGSIDLSSIELPTDNLHAYYYTYFDEAIFYNASIFWLTRTQSGQRGRVFYSPIGRNESVQGYINVCNDTQGCQKFFEWGGLLYVITKEGIYQIQGTNPYIPRRIGGCPGTNKPHTVVSTPYGVIYESDDALRVFDGSRATIAAPDTIERLFRGEDIENLTSFSGTIATYARNEYIISDTSQTLALFLSQSHPWSWRDIGISVNALHYAREVDIIGATVSSEVLDLEKEGELDDNGTEIALAWTPPAGKLHPETAVLLNNLILDIVTNDEQVTVTLILDGTSYAAGTVQTSSREAVTINVGKYARVASVQLTGSVTNKIELFEVAYVIYDPTK